MRNPGLRKTIETVFDCLLNIRFPLELKIIDPTIQPRQERDPPPIIVGYDQYGFPEDPWHIKNTVPGLKIIGSLYRLSLITTLSGNTRGMALHYGG